jgi:hypothetical protein
MTECIGCRKPIRPWHRWEWALCGYNQKEHKACYDARNECIARAEAQWINFLREHPEFIPDAPTSPRLP